MIIVLSFVLSTFLIRTVYLFILSEGTFRDRNLLLIDEKLASIDFDFIYELPNIDQKCLMFKSILLDTINSIAPAKKSLLRNNKNHFPWFDLDLFVAT